jgi:sugar O-acyltransferase (sialic acid O-acetyltransferase NeuD family)
MRSACPDATSRYGYGVRPTLPGLVIIGAGGHGREVLDLVEAVNTVRPTYRFLGFLDDGSPDRIPLARRGARVLGGAGALAVLDADYLVGIADPGTRRALDERAGATGRRAATLVHPRAVVGGDVVLGPGTVVGALASVTTNVRTGRGTLIGIGASIAHDCRLGDYATLLSGARLGGAVIVDDGVCVGPQAVVASGLRIGPATTVGAGAVVVRDLPGGVLALGVPARPTSRAAVGIGQQ